MAELSKQIKALYLEGHTVAEIADMLNESVEDIEMIVVALRVMSKQGIIEEPTNKDNNSIPNPVAAASNDSTITSNAQEIYKNAQAKVADRLVRIALYEQENVSAATKACIYVHEEAIGRNAERAKSKQDAGKGLLAVGEAMLRLQKMKNAVADAIDIDGRVSNLALRGD